MVFTSFFQYNVLRNLIIRDTRFTPYGAYFPVAFDLMNCFCYEVFHHFSFLTIVYVNNSNLSFECRTF